jgi:phosphoglycolate phosphatase
VRYDLALFDFDGTLADTFPLFARLLGGIAERFAFRALPEAELEALRGRPTREVLSQLGVPIWRVPAILRYGRQQMAAAQQDIVLFAGIDALLHELAARGVRIAVVSSNSESTVRATLGTELSACISVFSCGASMFGKSVRVRRILRQLHVPAHRAVLIGDEERDIAAARAAGVVSVAVTWGYATGEALQDADLMVDCVDALANMLLSNDAGHTSQ